MKEFMIIVSLFIGSVALVLLLLTTVGGMTYEEAIGKLLVDQQNIVHDHYAQAIALDTIDQE
tara:strand:- start:21764 stop:21949 length:186 start_codon:yes stop_codon:yes gene_type:complete